MQSPYNRRERLSLGLHPCPNGGAGAVLRVQINDGERIAGEVGPRLFCGGAFFVLLRET
jgi:hypothetical protein